MPSPEVERKQVGQFILPAPSPEVVHRQAGQYILSTPSPEVSGKQVGQYILSTPSSEMVEVKEVDIIPSVAAYRPEGQPAHSYECNGSQFGGYLSTTVL